jgi:hypothetical protein
VPSNSKEHCPVRPWGNPPLWYLSWNDETQLWLKKEETKHDTCFGFGSLQHSENESSVFPDDPKLANLELSSSQLFPEKNL